RPRGGGGPDGPPQPALVAQSDDRTRNHLHIGQIDHEHLVAALEMAPHSGSSDGLLQLTGHLTGQDGAHAGVVDVLLSTGVGQDQRVWVLDGHRCREQIRQRAREGGQISLCSEDEEPSLPFAAGAPHRRPHRWSLVRPPRRFRPEGDWGSRLIVGSAQMTPWESIASATLMKPAMLAPAT